MPKSRISTVFKTAGQPTTTYVTRENGVYENRLRAGLEASGRLCLVTGPSKTGKTTLYSRVLLDMEHVPLIIRCDDQLSAEEFWARALEGINFERIASTNKTKGSETSSTGKLGGKIGWAWLAGLIGEVALGIKKTMSESEIREKILAKPSPQHLIPALKNLPITLIVEDFHYLAEATKATIFQQWKIFVDNEVSVVVVGTTHHAVDLARANKDLLGRITQIELDRWTQKDLESILKQGFEYLKLRPMSVVSQELAREAVGLPIVMQDACRQLFIDKNLREVTKGMSIEFTKQDAYKALHNVAISNYHQLEALYERLKTGPRKKARKYDTYELVLSVFAKDPLAFALKRHEIDERLDSMQIRPERRPPPQSINSTLKALSRFQKSNGLELLEWSAKDQKLYIMEPTFLFYLRWREDRSKPPGFSDMLQSILGRLEGILSYFNKEEKQ